MTVREFALRLLEECGCKLDCYKGDFAKYALPDLQEASKVREFPFSLEEIAKELIAIGNEQPDPLRKGHKPFQMIFDCGHTIDGIEHDTFEDAKFDAIETLAQWMVDEKGEWAVDANGIPHPTEAQIESWDQMIADCCVYVVEWDEEEGSYQDADDAWYPSAEDENEAEWLTWDELKEKHGW